jgi:hypothetical protein
MGALLLALRVWQDAGGQIADETLRVALINVYARIGVILSFLSRLFAGETEAWDWMVHGATWISDKLLDLAAGTSFAVHHITHASIPNSIRWLDGRTHTWVRGDLAKVYGWAGSVFRQVFGELHVIQRWIATHGKQAANWIATDGLFLWRWVRGFGVGLFNLVMNPSRLVTWILGALLKPLIRALLFIAPALLVWVVKLFAGSMPLIAHNLEDGFHDLI